jgi:hypothetical protein
MRLIHWIIFGGTQCLGLILIVLDHGPCVGIFAIPGLVMLLPGCLIVFALPHGWDKLPQWTGYLLEGSGVICVNALLWYLVGKISDRQLKSTRRSPEPRPF